MLSGILFNAFGVTGNGSLEIDSGYNKMLINTSVASPNYSITTTSLDCASTSSDNFRGKVLTNASAIGGYTFEFASAASNTNTMIIFSTLATVVGTIAVYSLTNNSHPQEFLNDGGNRNAPESGDDEFEDDEIDEQTVQALAIHIPKQDLAIEEIAKVLRAGP